MGITLTRKYLHSQRDPSQRKNVIKESRGNSRIFAPRLFTSLTFAAQYSEFTQLAKTIDEASC